jgi:hypothetical protein
MESSGTGRSGTGRTSRRDPTARAPRRPRARKAAPPCWTAAARLPYGEGAAIWRRCSGGRHALPGSSGGVREQARAVEGGGEGRVRARAEESQQARQARVHEAALWRHVTTFAARCDAAGFERVSYVVWRVDEPAARREVSFSRSAGCARGLRSVRVRVSADELAHQQTWQLHTPQRPRLARALGQPRRRALQLVVQHVTGRHLVRVRVVHHVTGRHL